MQDEAAMSFRLSPQQELLWSMHPSGPAGGAVAAVDLQGDVDVARVRHALQALVRRHEILRTTFPQREGMRLPLQVVAESLEPAFEVVDLTGLSRSERETRLDGFLAAARSRTWDYERGPLVHATLALLDATHGVLLLSVAPPCADAASLSTAVAEIASHYGGGEAADEPLQYADFAEWQQQLLEGDDEEAEAGRRFWSELDLGQARSMPFVRPGAPSATTTIDIPLDDPAIVVSAAAQIGVPPATMVQTALHVVAARTSGDRIPVAVVPAQRLHGELESAIGAFARALPVRVSPAEGATFADVAAQADRAQDVAERWQDYAPADVAAPFGVAFIAVDPLPATESGGATFSFRRVEPAAIAALAVEWDGSCRLRFDPAAVDADTAARVARWVGNVLSAGAASPSTPVDELQLLGDEDVERLTLGVNATAEAADIRPVHELFAAAAARHATAAAVVDEDGALTYAELDEQANKLANRLVAAGVGAGSTVGLCTDRSTAMIVALLGILKAGAAYLPLNFEHPPARLAHQLAETDAPAVVTQAEYLDRLRDFDRAVVCLDRERAEIDAQPSTAPAVAVDPESPVYVLYTSGSTGTPKGVVVTHANVANYVHALSRRLGADATPLAFGMVTAISTDLGNTAVFPALCSGGTLVLVSPAAAADTAAAAAFLRAHPIDVLKITPSHLSALLSGADAADVLPRAWLVIGGEALSWDLVARVRELGSCRILNHYGPTETTIGACTNAVGDGPGTFAPATVPIGRPIANAVCYVLDEQGRCVPEGALGELFIGGAGVARGYAGRPELTAERFLADPFVAGGRMYATGDLVRRLPDGAIEFVGRRDDQLKIRGFRVEPSEIESVLRRHGAVQDAVVIGRDEGRGERRLVAYVVTSGAVTADELKRHAAEWLPDVMIPSACVILDAFPLTPSGKVDRLALPAPESATTVGDAYVAPRTPVEEAVAAIWSDVLRIERIGIDDDFFALGGHSLLATQIIAQIRSGLGVNLPLHSLFTAPTVATLSAQVVELMGGDEETARLLAEVDSLSDEEVERLLAGEAGAPDETA